MGDRRAEAIRLLWMAQSGRAEDALSAAQAALSRAEPTADLSVDDGTWYASLHYVRGVALHCQGSHEAALEAGGSVLQAAEQCGDSAWASVGRAFQALQSTLHAESDPVGADGGVLLQELARAEVDIADSPSEPFAVVTAHTAVGGCYLHLRLYELAEPHLVAAADISAAHPELLRLTAVAARLNLAELHLGWSLELRRVGLASAAAERSLTAGRHADEAFELGSSQDSASYRERARLLSACAGSDTREPAEVIRTIRAGRAASAGRGQGDEAAMAWLFEARALFRAGDPAGALAASHRACEKLPHGAIGTLAAAALHTRAELLVRSGGDGAEILAYGDHLAQGLWSHRLRALHLARSMQVFERLRRERDSMHELAYTDALTGAGNRHAFDEWLTRQAAGPAGTVGLCVVDVDDLKAVNDRGGHAAGDLVLRSVAAVLRFQVGPEDLVARLGGDEFVVCSTQPATRGAAFADGLVEAIAAALAGEASVSIGLACGPAEEAGTTVLRAADQAMYLAKREGGGRARLLERSAALPHY